jgi:hypothetical protein
LKLPKGKVLGKLPGGPGVVIEALRQAPRGLNGYVRVVGPKGSGQIGVVLVIKGDPIGCLVTGGQQSFGKESVPALHALASDPGSQVRLIGFYEESMAEVKTAAENMRRVAGISRAELETPPSKEPRAQRPSNPAAKEIAESVTASSEAPEGSDPAFLRELLEAGVRAAQEESRASGEPLDVEIGGKLEEYLSRSDLRLDDAFATFATALSPKPPAKGAPKERLPPALADELSREEADLKQTAKQYEYQLAKEMGSAKALRDQEVNLEKMEASLRDLKSSVQVEGERRLAEMEKLGRQAGPEASAVLRKLREEQEAMYARVEKLVQMESLFQQNLLTQRRRINEKESELQQMASQLKQDFLERKRLLDEEKESYLEELRRQSKDLRTREQVAAQREKKAAELSDRLEGEIRQKIEQIETRREELEGREKELKARAETIASREAAAEGGGKVSKVAAAALEKERQELAKERESFASKIASLAKREEELRALEARVGAAGADGALQMSPEQLEEARDVVKFLDKLLEMLPDEKVTEFAQSDYYQMYVRLLERLGI